MKINRIKENGFHEFLNQLIVSGYLNETQNGICKQVIGRGYDSLSSKQKGIFDKMIDSIRDVCTVTGETIPMDELFESLQNGHRSEDGVIFENELTKEDDKL